MISGFLLSHSITIIIIITTGGDFCRQRFLPRFLLRSLFLIAYLFLLLLFLPHWLGSGVLGRGRGGGRLPVPRVRAETHATRRLLAYTTQFFMRACLADMSEFFAIKTDSVVTVISKMTAAVTFSTGMFLAVMG